MPSGRAAGATARRPSKAPTGWLGDVLKALPERLREPVVLHYYADLTVDDVGRALGRPSGTIKRQLSDARSPAGGDAAEGGPMTDRPDDLPTGPMPPAPLPDGELDRVVRRARGSVAGSAPVPSAGPWPAPHWPSSCRSPCATTAGPRGEEPDVNGAHPTTTTTTSEASTTTSTLIGPAGATTLGPRSTTSTTVAHVPSDGPEGGGPVLDGRVINSEGAPIAGIHVYVNSDGAFAANRGRVR